MTARLTRADIGAWLLKSARALDAGWASDTEVDLARCVRPSYRLDLVTAGQPCVLWVSGRADPGVHAVGVVTGPVEPGEDGPVLPARWRRLPEPVPREALLADPVARSAEVLRMPAGSNPSWLSPAQWSVVQAMTAGWTGGR
ncbi:hypothetical protein [Modestobacter sp. Leaf380]|uniref:hypothetical protein n=1 Tax=Modestobacter sp. Leaf380 TaxID=1736356 RepID=UPI0006F8C4DE|nr:hypothetical protein [Modestobacter sp. Leaf380]KQS69349.1 hypothetical protein ASG41_21390 [Modestobacter sp. Leaf380]